MDGEPAPVDLRQVYGEASDLAHPGGSNAEVAEEGIQDAYKNRLY